MHDVSQCMYTCPHECLCMLMVHMYDVETTEHRNDIWYVAILLSIRILHNRYYQVNGDIMQISISMYLWSGAHLSVHVLGKLSDEHLPSSIAAKRINF